MKKSTAVRNGGSSRSHSSPHVVHLSRGFVVLSMVLPALLAFAVGYGSRMSWFLESGGQLHPASVAESSRIQQKRKRKRLGAVYLLHLDLKDLDSDFLLSEVSLFDVMVKTAAALKRGSRFSHNCYKRKSSGLSCITVFPEGGFISILTTPTHGVALMDVVTCVNQEEDIVALVPGIRKLFQERQADPNRELRNMWSVKIAGPHAEDFDSMLDDHDNVYLERIASVTTRFQTVDVYDSFSLPREIIFERKLEALSADSNTSSYAARFPDQFEPNRLVFLNSVLQSTRSGDAPYHEALVHPAMIAHDHPERVAIIGGGEGATLREILKHNTVKQAIMVEIDGLMMNTSREVLPDWNSCEDFIDSTDSCFDDSRANVYAEDALAWFIDRFHADKEKIANARGLENAEPIDVIIMDALDPTDDADFCEILYNNDAFFEALYNALSDEGILVIQLGESPDSHDAPDGFGIHRLRASVVERLGNMGFESLHVYSEGHCDFHHPWTYMVAFKDWDTTANWYANEAEINLKLRQRSVLTRSGQSPFRYFDGATMKSYQQPHMSFQKAFCRESPTPWSCIPGRSGYDPNRPNTPVTSLEVKRSEVGRHVGRGLFTTVDIAEGSYIGLEQFFKAVTFPPTTFALISRLLARSDAVSAIFNYMDGYGFESGDYGGTICTVDSSTMTFANHGCNGTHNLGNMIIDATSDFAESLGKTQSDVEETSLFRVYNPALDRNLRLSTSGGDVSRRKILQGEEILSDYLTMVNPETEEWAKYEKDLQSQCAGAMGEVVRYEQGDTE